MSEVKEEELAVETDADKLFGDEKNAEEKSSEESSEKVVEAKEAGDSESSEESSAEDSEQEKELDELLNTKEDSEDDSKEESKEDKEAKELELKLPEGTKLTESRLEGLKEFAEKNSLTEEQAQELIEQESKIVDEYHNDLVEKHKKQTGEWLEELKADKEFGGDGLRANAKKTFELVKRFGSDELKQAFNDTGYGNHPEMFKFLVRISNELDITQDKLEHGKAAGATQPKTAEQLFYGNSPN